MNIITSLLALIGTLAINITLILGYPGIAFLMALESTAVPLPSELILPFAGYLIAVGKLNIWLVLLSSTIGTLIGSLVSYAMGYYGGNQLVLKFGKYCFLDETDLVRTENWFRRQGDATIFIARFIPVVRHLISIPAGIAKMDLKKFCFYTLVGGFLWNSILIYFGYIFGQNWRIIRHYTEPFSILIAGILVILAIIFAWRHLRHKLKQ
jgi:membrane protein DedA with SNARE-associated domain